MRTIRTIVMLFISFGMLVGCSSSQEPAAPAPAPAAAPAPAPDPDAEPAPAPEPVSGVVINKMIDTDSKTRDKYSKSEFTSCLAKIKAAEAIQNITDRNKALRKLSKTCQDILSHGKTNPKVTTTVNDDWELTLRTDNNDEITIEIPFDHPDADKAANVQIGQRWPVVEH